MVYYMHAFGQRGDDSSNSSSISEVVSNESTLPESASSSTSSDDASFSFGKKKTGDKFMAQILCAAKLGFLAGILTILLGYLSVTMFNQSWFRKQDPVNRKPLVDWQKLVMYAGVVFLIVTIIVYALAANKMMKW